MIPSRFSMSAVPLLLVALSLAGPTAILAAPPKDTAQDLLAKAKEKARAAEPAAAAGLYGDALALVQKQGDLLVEQDVCTALEEFLERLPNPPVEGGKDVAPVVGTPREVLAAVMARLDAKRCGGFVSAPCIAGELLLLAVEKGDSLHVKEAAAVLGNHAKGKSGLGLATLAKFATILQETPSGGAPPADDAGLDAIVATATQESWTDLAMAAALEKAARCASRAGQEEAATAAVKGLAVLVTPSTDVSLVQWLRQAAGRRLSSAPAAVRKPLDDALEALGSKGAAGSAGGRGADGKDAGSRGSPLGEILRKGPRTAGLGTMGRTKEGFELRIAWDPKYRGVHQHQDGVQNLDDGGLTVAVCDWSVALMMVDPDGTKGQPGASSRPDAGRAFYRVARGESWALRADGVVSVGK